MQLGDESAAHADAYRVPHQPPSELLCTSTSTSATIIRTTIGLLMPSAWEIRMVSNR
jgi:hypothetical protein